MSDFSIHEWLNLAVRWAHVFAGILWVGQTYYFTWLDGRFADETNVWMIHSGGFYVVGREKSPAAAPPRLHWFRFEALTTWATGMVMLVMVYYVGELMVDERSTMSHGVAVAVALGIIAAAWIAYDAVSQTPLGRSERAFAAVALGAIAGIAFLLTRLFASRAAYIHVGAVFGTIMTANVWFRILPAQRAMLRALGEGRKPDERLSARAKLRSKHNTFLAIPVVFLMISNHYPVATYGHAYNWLILTALVAAGWGAAKLVRRA